MPYIEAETSIIGIGRIPSAAQTPSGRQAGAPAMGGTPVPHHNSGALKKQCWVQKRCGSGRAVIFTPSARMAIFKALLQPDAHPMEARQ
jgi:hypothetical protein